MTKFIKLLKRIIIVNKKNIVISLVIIAVFVSLCIWVSLRFIRVDHSPDSVIPSPNPVHSCDSEILTMLIDKYDINKIEIYRCIYEPFKLDGREIIFILLEFNSFLFPPRYYCAIIEDGIDYPYDFYSDIIGSGFFQSRDADESVMTGWTHPLANDLKFNNFLKKQSQNGGPFRYCK